MVVSGSYGRSRLMTWLAVALLLSAGAALLQLLDALRREAKAEAQLRTTGIALVLPLFAYRRAWGERSSSCTRLKRLRPGLFVRGFIEVGGEQVDLVVPRNSVVDLDQDKLVFVRKGNNFEPRMVSVGVQTLASIEVLSGLKPGEEIVIAGAFHLKAELLKGTFDPHAGHAH